MSVLTPDVSDASDLCLAADWPGDTVLHCVTVETVETGHTCSQPRLTLCVW